MALEHQERETLETTKRPIIELPYLAGGIDTGSSTTWRRSLLRTESVDDRHHGCAGGRSPRLAVDDMLSDPRVRVIVCCGSGGVGKTTTAAALALRAAEAGRQSMRVDDRPARRLAQSMGLTGWTTPRGLFPTSPTDR